MSGRSVRASRRSLSQPQQHHRAALVRQVFRAGGHQTRLRAGRATDCGAHRRNAWTMGGVRTGTGRGRESAGRHGLDRANAPPSRQVGPEDRCPADRVRISPPLAVRICSDSFAWREQTNCFAISAVRAFWCASSRSIPSGSASACRRMNPAGGGCRMRWSRTRAVARTLHEKGHDGSYGCRDRRLSCSLAALLWTLFAHWAAASAAISF